MKLKNNLRVLLAKHDLNQRDFAEKTGISQRTVSVAVNQELVRYPIHLIEAMVREFKITDMNEIFTIVNDDKEVNEEK